eukprot:5099904-Prymnesium_polylepis.3
MLSISRPLVAPHGLIPTTGIERCCAIAVPTIFITPASVPAVKIHAFADVDADTSPRLKLFSSCEESSKSCAPPETVMITSGDGNFQLRSMRLAKSATGAMHTPHPLSLVTAVEASDHRLRHRHRSAAWRGRGHRPSQSRS